MVSRVAGTSEHETGTLPNACTASEWKQMPASRHRSAMSRTGWTGPRSDLDGEQSRGNVGARNGDLAERLHGVGVEADARLATSQRHVAHRLDGAHFRSE